MLVRFLPIILYFTLMLLIGWLPERKRPEGGSIPRCPRTDESFFLSGKTLSAISLLVTMGATNFSAFTVLGLSGAGYRTGFAFFPVMAFGTGFMALAMYLVGSPLGRLGKERGYISPVDFIGDRYGSPLLSKIYAVVLVILTLPYLALQPMAAGMILESAFGVPYRIGTILCAAVVGLYTARGGMRAVVRTDMIQGVLMLILAAAAYGAVVSSLGGFAAAYGTAFSAAPALFSRAGSTGEITPTVLAGYIILWFFADPMFPQLTQRFLAAKDRESLERTVIVYPLVTMALFFLTISVGVLGAAGFPGLDPSEADRIWPLMVSKAASPVLLPIFMIAPLAAIMSTLDSQLLTLSSIIIRDLGGKRDTKPGKTRIVTALVSAAGLCIALFPPGNILDFINRSSFLGYAALSPLLFGGLYGGRFSARGAFAALFVGEGLTLLLGLRVISTGPIPAIFVVCAASWLALFAGSAGACANSAATRAGAAVMRRTAGGLPAASGPPGDTEKRPLPVVRLGDQISPAWAGVFAGLFLLACDFFRYFRGPGGGGGLGGGAAGGGGTPAGWMEGTAVLPGWLWFQGILCVLLSAVFYLFFTRSSFRSGCSRTSRRPRRKVRRRRYSPG